MTDAPEKIWAWSEPADCGKGVQKFWISNPAMVDGSETAYIREDIHEAALRSHDRLEKVCVAQDDKLKALEAENKRLRQLVQWPVKTSNAPPNWRITGE